MKKIILFALLAVSATMAMAQINPKSGIIITNSGDTIRGIIDFRTNETLSRECEFWAEGKTDGKIYKPGDIEGFRFDGNGKYFVTRKLDVDGKPRLYFAEFMVKGKMNLYCVADNPNEYFFFEREDGEMVKLTNIPHSSCLSTFQEEEDFMRIKKEQYGKVRYLLKDSKTAIEDIKQKNLLKTNLSRKGLVDVVRDYHNDVCTDGSTCMVYEYDEKSDKSKFRFKVFAGFAYYSKVRPELMSFSQGRNSEIWKSVSYSGSSFEFGIGIEKGIERFMKNGSIELCLAYSPKCSFERKDVAFDGKRHYDAKYESDARMALSLGLVKPYGKGKILPLVRGGVMFEPTVNSGKENLLYADSKSYVSYNSAGSADVGICIGEKKTDAGPKIVPSGVGVYLGAGAQMAVGKHFARLHANLYSDWNTTIKWGITAEFVL
ncbi:MAG: hypothetical protein II834_08280 [Bacteroidaceae bacterium]|nr:hypothetical protein [Bacteroidaceae bacterium]